MLSWLLGPIRGLVRALVNDDSPRQLAIGIALGVMLGLVPKGNLTALALAALLLSTRVNIAAGLAAAAVFSGVGRVLDPFAHKLGWLVLSHQPLQAIYAWLFDLPLAAWTGLNNTVVVGQLLIGLYSAFPAYWIGKRVLAKLRPWAAVRIRKYHVTRVLLGIDTGARWSLCE